MKVRVYDRYRFGFPVEGEVIRLSKRRDHGEGVEVKLTTTNNSHFPVGSKIWVHRHQVRAIVERPE